VEIFVRKPSGSAQFIQGEQIAPVGGPLKK
jgi:hypothetical protein